jgi:hypothetical protein
MDVLFELSGTKSGQGIQWPAPNMLFIKRLLEAQYIDAIPPKGGVWINGMHASPYIVTITDVGRRFLADLGLKEL